MADLVHIIDRLQINNVRPLSRGSYQWYLDQFEVKDQTFQTIIDRLPYTVDIISCTQTSIGDGISLTTWTITYKDAKKKK